MKRLPNDLEWHDGVTTTSLADKPVRPLRREDLAPAGRTLPQRPPAGLCVTCIYAETCALRFATEGAVLMCEEFDDRVPDAGATPVAEAEVEHPAPAVLSMATGLSALKGLCMDCEDRETCRLPRSPEGVWDCEEYR
jgi:hypothetical protein